MGTRVAGVCYVKADGYNLTIEGGVEYPLSPTMREGVKALAKVPGYKETIREPYLKLSAIVETDFPRQALASMTNGSITVETAVGAVYYLSDAWVEGEINYDPVEGKVDIEFRGTSHNWG